MVEILNGLKKCILHLEQEINSIENGELDDDLEKIMSYHVPPQFMEYCEGCIFPSLPIPDIINKENSYSNDQLNNHDQQGHSSNLSPSSIRSSSRKKVPKDQVILRSHRIRNA